MKETRKLAAVMFTDIIGYTALMSKDERKALALLKKNRELQKSLAEKHNGEFLKEMGDGTLLCFQSALDAVRCAMEIQQSVKDDTDLNLRIGIHTGDIVFKEGDVFGDGVNVASRIEKLAETGGICISEHVYQSVRNQPTIDAVFLDEKKLKNVDHPIKIYALGGEGSSVPQFNGLIPKEKGTKEKSIIVLPFDDMSPDKDNEYFSDGLTEEIITDLSHIHDLLVISRNSAMTFKGTKKKTKEIAREVNVNYVLEGSVRKAGNNLRIAAQLIDAKNDAHLWAKKYKGTLDDIFDIQEEVSRSIVDALKVQLTPKESKQIAERPIDNVNAYEYYYHAKKEIYRTTEEGLNRALKDLQSGLEIVGENVLLNTGMAEAYLQYYEYGIKADEETLLNVEKYAKKIVEVQPDSDNSYYLLGRIERFRGSCIKAAQYLEKAYKVNPKNTSALLFLAHSYGMQLGKTTTAKQLYKELFELDPLTPLNYGTLGMMKMVSGELDKSLLNLKKFTKLAQDDLWENLFSVYIYAWLKQYDKTYEVVDLMVKQKSLSTAHKNLAEWCLFFKYELQREKKKALETISEDVKNYFWNDPECMWFGVCNYALINEKEVAFKWLEHIIERGWINYPFLNARMPFLENIRGEERFKKLMKRVKKEWENFKV